MRVEFHRGPRHEEYAVLIQREDGLTVRLPGNDGEWRIPHDLAHFVAEREFGLAHGVYGCIGAGAMFGNMSLVDRRPRYNTRSRSRAVLRASASELNLAESLSGVVHEAVEQRLDPAAAYRRLRVAWDVLRPEPCPYDPADLRRVFDVLDQLGARWRQLTPGDVMTLHWELPDPDNLQSIHRGR
jgi:hypothetical protein